MTKRVICFGDSVIFGTGATSLKLGCGRILRALLKAPVLVSGANNDTSADGLKRLNNDVVEREKYSHVIVLFGNNDCKLIDIDKPFISVENYKNNMKRIIDEIKYHDKTPILSNLQPISDEGFYGVFPEMKKLMLTIKSPVEWHKKYSDALTEVADFGKVKLVNIYSTLSHYGKKVLSNDGLHPNDLGHKIIANEFRKALEG